MVWPTLVGFGLVVASRRAQSMAWSHDGSAWWRRPPPDPPNDIGVIWSASLRAWALDSFAHRFPAAVVAEPCGPGPGG